MSRTSLPLHPTRRHPHTGLALRAIWVRPDGRVCWPMLGGSPDDPAGGDPAGGGNGGGGGNDDPSGGGGSGGGNARDSKGRDLGYPADTPVDDMSDGQQAAYWRHRSQKHEGRTKALTGDRSFDETKANLEAFEKWQREQQTPADQALQARYDQGRADAEAESNTKAATAILRANLTAQGYEGTELDELADLIDVRKFITDGEIDTDRMAATAKKFTRSDKDDKQDRRRDFGGGDRSNRGGGSGRGSAGQAALERRFGKKSTTGS